MRRIRLVVCAGGALFLGACAAPINYGPYLDHMPRSILVLPPLNLTTDVEAPGTFAGTITTPLAEYGYYVFPVAVVEDLMKENGLPTPGEMHQVPLSKLAEVFDADAVLYITLKEWATQYRLVDTSTIVRIEYRLVDVRSGTELWHQQIRQQQSSSAGARSLPEMLVGALVSAVAKTASAPERGVARKANQTMFDHPACGLLKGPRHPDFEKDQVKHGKPGAAQTSATAASADARP